MDSPTPLQGRALPAGSGAQNRISSFCPLPPGSRALNPTSQDARLAAGSFVWRGAVREPALTRSRHARIITTVSARIISRHAPLTTAGEGNHAVAGSNGSGVALDDYPST